MSDRQVDEALVRRVEAAVSAAVVSREAVNFDWPECHRKNCQYRHGSTDSAFGTMKSQILRTVRDELAFETTTRPDVSEKGDTPAQAAALNLAVLLSRYNVHKTGTYIKAAQLIIDAYPALITALNQGDDDE